MLGIHARADAPPLIGRLDSFFSVMGIIPRAGLPTSLELSENPRQVLAESIIRNDGILTRVSHELGISRDALRLKVYKYILWPVVNAVRKRRIERNRKFREKQGG